MNVVVYHLRSLSSAGRHFTITLNYLYFEFNPSSTIQQYGNRAPVVRANIYPISRHSVALLVIYHAVLIISVLWIFERLDVACVLFLAIQSCLFGGKSLVRVLAGATPFSMVPHPADCIWKGFKPRWSSIIFVTQVIEEIIMNSSTMFVM